MSERRGYGSDTTGTYTCIYIHVYTYTCIDIYIYIYIYIYKRSYIYIRRSYGPDHWTTLAQTLGHANSPDPVLAQVCAMRARTHTQAHTHAYLHIHIRRQTRTHTRKHRHWRRHRLYAMPILQTLCYCGYVLCIVVLWTDLATNSVHDIGTDTVRRQLVRPCAIAGICDILSCHVMDRASHELIAWYWHWHSATPTLRTLCYRRFVLYIIKFVSK